MHWDPAQPGRTDGRTADSLGAAMSNPAADGVRWTAALDRVVAETAAGRLLPGVHRCLLRVETPHRLEGWTGAATAHLVLADQGHCRLDDPTGRYLPSDLVDRFCDSTGRPYGAAITLRQLLDHTSGLPNFFSQPPILDAVQHGSGRRRFTPLDLVDLAAAGQPPTSPPGTARSYTDTGFLLAGLIIEALTRRPL